jgi:hypothetical protein
MLTTTFPVVASSVSYAVTPHLAIIPPNPVPVPMPHVECCPMFYGWQFAAIAETVEFDDSRAVQLGHDVGFLIPHWSVPNPNLAAVIAFSKCQVHYAKSTVLVCGKPAGYWLPGIAMFQVCADPFSMPLGFNVTAQIGSTVKFGFSWGDQIAGQVRIGIDIGLSLVARGIFGKIAQKGAKWLAGRLMRTKLGDHLERAVERYAARESERLGDEAIDEVIRHGRLEAIVRKAVWDTLDRVANKGLNKGAEKTTKRGAKEGHGDLRWLGPWIDSQIDAPPPPVLDGGPGLLDEVPMLEGGEDAP